MFLRSLRRRSLVVRLLCRPGCFRHRYRGGKKRNQAPTDFKTSAAWALLWLERLSRIPLCAARRSSVDKADALIDVFGHFKPETFQIRSSQRSHGAGKPKLELAFEPG